MKNREDGKEKITKIDLWTCFFSLKKRTGNERRKFWFKVYKFFFFSFCSVEGNKGAWIGEDLEDFINHEFWSDVSDWEHRTERCPSLSLSPFPHSLCVFVLQCRFWPEFVIRFVKFFFLCQQWKRQRQRQTTPLCWKRRNERSQF